MVMLALQDETGLVVHILRNRFRVKPDCIDQLKVGPKDQEVALST